MKRRVKLFDKFIKRIGKTDNLLIKGFFTFLFPNKFFKSFYSRALNSKHFENVATISFDCDHVADIEFLPILLETLSSYDIKASFACVGKLIEKYPKEHQMIIENGHEIINHTYTHPYNKELNSLKKFNKLTKEEQKEEIIKCHQICDAILEYEPIGFRIPHFGVQYRGDIYEILSEMEYSYSSSVLAVKSPTFGTPYSKNGILEFPITTCPQHPFQAFDTYHSFRSKLTSHKDEEDFFNVFKTLIEFWERNNIYINLYFDPQDLKLFKDFGKLFEFIRHRKTYIKAYKDITIKYNQEGKTDAK